MIIPVLRKILVSRTWVVDEYKYTFTDVYPWDGDENLPSIEVNVQLPKPFQSYILKKMMDDAQQIISDVIQYTGQEIETVNMNLLLDGLEPLKVFITLPKVEEIINKCNIKMNPYVYLTHNKDTVLCDIEFVPSKKFYITDGWEIDFSFNLLVSNVKFNDEKVELNKNQYDGLSKIIEDSINLDSDTFRSDIEGIIYETLEPDVKIQNNDNIYYHVYFNVTHLNGKKVSPSDESANDKELEIFT